MNEQISKLESAKKTISDMLQEYENGNLRNDKLPQSILYFLQELTSGLVDLEEKISTNRKQGDLK